MVSQQKKSVIAQRVQNQKPSLRNLKRIIMFSKPEGRLLSSQFPISQTAAIKL